MDDLFDAFSSNSSAVTGHLLAAAATAPKEGKLNPDSLPSAELSGHKRRRDEAAAEKKDKGDELVDMLLMEKATKTKSSKRAAAADGELHDVGDAIAAAATLEVDAGRKGEVLVDYAAVPEDREDSELEGKQEQRGGAAAAAGGSKAGGAAAGASSNYVSVATDKPRLLRGDIDEGKTTAPDASPELLERKPAKEYPFTLDPFQKRAIECLERDESVLVSAHTSAGKTVVAEYAIAMALRDKQRVIYTSPIKALSNQKYRDMYETFSDVGLMTGDVTINPNASCLVMTTEILRSMLYRGSEVMREVKWIIFDEIHYMRDKERGVVWEESIILVPHKVRFVFLSATIPNSKEFAEWVAKIHHQTCHVVYTDYRPTPLQHFIFPAGGEGVYLVVDEKGRFREDNFSKAMATLGQNSTALSEQVEDVVSKGAGKKGAAKASARGKGDTKDLYRIVKMIMERHYDPVIVFSFSKRECETYALQLAKVDLTTAEEKKLIEKVFLSAIDSLNEDDKKLPQIEAILPLLKRGIGIHHGGLLPLLKEVIEILFQESLLKVLFATETFSMGINMPARTVVFTASRKFDGTDFRWISPGEYIQMSGRAGRRGLDDRGIVIQMIDEKMEPAAAKEILKGCSDPLNSAFHLSYNMLLNLSRVEDANPEDLMGKSFHQFQNEKAAPAMEEELGRLQEQRDQLSASIADEPAVAEYYSLCSAMEQLSSAIQKTVTQPQYALPFLQPGRLVRVKEEEGGSDWGWGVVISFSKKNSSAGALGGAQRDEGTEFGKPGGKTGSVVIVDVLLPCSTAAAAAAPAKGGAGGPAAAPRPMPLSAAEAAAGKGEMKVVPVLLPLLSAISSARVYIPKDLRPKEARDGMWDNLKEVQRRCPGGLPLLDPVEDMQIASEEFKELVSKSIALQARITASPVHKAGDREERFERYKQKLLLEEQMRFLQGRIKSCRSLVMKETLKKMRRVLRRLGHCDDGGVVLTKGRVACEINTADELLCTELIFEGTFKELDPAQAAALLSCLVYGEKSSNDNGDTAPALREELAAPFRKLQEAARRIAQVSQDCKIEGLEVEDYVASFKPDMMELVYAWVQGAKFIDLCSMTKQFEGSIIRVIRRLEELTRQLADAAKAIGEESLQKKFAESSAKMRRDIIFAASLYL